MILEERNKLIEENMSLVYHIANKYFYNYWDIEELIGEGFIGLIRAAEKFDSSKDLKFTTFAYTCIYNEMCKYIAIQNYDCRRANIGTFSVDKKLYDDNEVLTMKELLECDEDYSVASVNSLLDLIDRFKIKNARFICQKRVEGYYLNEIGEMIGVSRESVRQTIQRIKLKLTGLGITA